MGAGWIKMRKSLRDDREAVLIAMRTELDIFSVIGRLHVLWCWCDENTIAGLANAVTLEWIDAYVKHPGFAQAMVEAGWLVKTENGLLFPIWDKHNGESAKERALAARRQFKQRCKKRGGPPREKPSRANRDGTVTPPSRPPNYNHNHNHNTNQDGVPSSNSAQTSAGTAESEPETETPAELKRPSAKTDRPSRHGSAEESRTPPSSKASNQDPEQSVLLFPCAGEGGRQWPLFPSKVRQWQESFPGIDVLAACRAARQWLYDNPKRGKTYDGMTRFLGNWLTREQNKAPATPMPLFSQTAATPRETAAERLQRLIREQQGGNGG